jgi:hypothetical protein
MDLSRTWLKGSCAMLHKSVSRSWGSSIMRLWGSRSYGGVVFQYSSSQLWGSSSMQLWGRSSQVEDFVYTQVVITRVLSIVGLGYGCVDLVAFPYRLNNLVGYASGLVIRLG